MWWNIIISGENLNTRYFSQNCLKCYHCLAIDVWLCNVLMWRMLLFDGVLFDVFIEYCSLTVSLMVLPLHRRMLITRNGFSATDSLLSHVSLEFCYSDINHLTIKWKRVSFLCVFKCARITIKGINRHPLRWDRQPPMKLISRLI